MPKPIAVITARSASKRLARKNMLPLNGMSLTEISVKQAVAAGLFTVVTSDIDVVLQNAIKSGAYPVRRPEEFCDGNSHFATIKHAVESAIAIDASYKESPVVLLQPTSPFRGGNIIKKCIEANAKNPDRVVLSGRTLHCTDASGKSISTQIWDGCVAVFPHNCIQHQDNAIIVENEHSNMLQVDTNEDYIQACVQSWRLGGCWTPIDQEEAKVCVAALKPLFNNTTVTLVGGYNGEEIDQSKPVFYTNHCRGWNGGRADALVVVACKSIVNIGINKELEEVALKASVVIVRDLGQADWVLANLKTTAKIILVKSCKHQITTGSFASTLISLSGGTAERIGFQRGADRVGYTYQCFPTPRTSDEIALLEISGYDKTSFNL